MPATRHPACRITVARTRLYRQRIATFPASVRADRLDTATNAGIILADQQRDVLAHAILMRRAINAAHPRDK